MQNALAKIEVLFFDTFGTVVDWRTSIIQELKEYGASKGFEADWPSFAHRWRGEYQPAMEEVRSGRRPFTILDALHRESLIRVLDEFQIERPNEAELSYLTTIWHRLDPWLDAMTGLHRLKQRYIISPLSNGNVALLTRLSKRAGLSWDVILGAETARAYKPQPEAYLRNACLLVAAHNSDLAAAKRVGFRTAFVIRSTEHGPNQKTDLRAEQDWDVIADNFHTLADALGCP